MRLPIEAHEKRGLALRVAGALLVVLATACESDPRGVEPTAVAGTTTSPTAADTTTTATATAAVSRAIGEEDLAIMVLGPAELGTVAAELAHSQNSGPQPNSAAAATSWDPGHHEAFWRGVGRITGYAMAMSGYAEDDSVFLVSSVELFRDQSAASRALDAWVSDVYFGDATRVGSGGLTDIIEYPVSELGDEAILVSARIAGSLEHVAQVFVRRGHLLGTITAWRADQAGDEDALALARLLDSRIADGLAGRLDAEPVPAPGPFNPREQLPAPAVLNDPSRATPIVDTGCPGSGPRICLMGIGADLGVDLDQFAEDFRSTYGLQVAVLPELSLDGRGADWPSLADYDRHRVDGTSLWRLVYTLYPITARDPEVTLIAVTSYDFYDAERPRLNYFYLKQGEDFVIASNARFDDSSFGLPPNPDALRSRTLKLVTRQIGQLHYGLPIDVGDDRHSLMQTFPEPWGVDRFDETLPLHLLP